MGFVGALQIVGVGDRYFLRGATHLASLSSVQIIDEKKRGMFNVLIVLNFLGGLWILVLKIWFLFSR